MFKKILIANRGEIAVRVMRTCREMGIATVAVFSDVDRGSLHVRYADEAYCIGEGPAIRSYLDIGAIIEVARKAGVEAIHPGYGFLSENSDFAKICRQNNFVFVGPDPEVIEKMGNKVVARKTMVDRGIPVIPGSMDPLHDFDAVESVCREIGFPVMLKAASGGGGKGMRIVSRLKELDDAYMAVRREAYAAFADTRILVEKYFPVSRHIEVQVLGDNTGKIIHLFERECSIQRRFQKVLEECPAPSFDDGLRCRLTAAAVEAARAVSYTGAGTVEFLVDENNNFYFLEMNTRIQVEHSVTEYVTGFDLVEEQLKIADGESIAIDQSQIHRNGCAIECRIYAEDIENNYMPAPGTIENIVFPSGAGVRVDSGVYEGWTVSLHYDPMIAKISTWGRTREEARKRMLRSLDECLLTGVKTNIPLHKKILRHSSFKEGLISTAFLDTIDMVDKEKSARRYDVAVIGAICSCRLEAERGRTRSADIDGAAGLWRMANKYQFWSTRF